MKAHKGPIPPNSPEYRGSSWNIQVVWDTGEITWEILNLISKPDPVSCAIYARKHNPLYMDVGSDLVALDQDQLSKKKF